MGIFQDPLLTADYQRPLCLPLIPSPWPEKKSKKTTAVILILLTQSFSSDSPIILINMIAYESLNFKKTVTGGISLVVQWLRLHAPNAGGPGSIPGQGTRSLTHAAT